MGGLLTLIGAAGFIGYLIWLVVCIRNWDSKIPPVIGMLLSLVMLVGGLACIPADESPKETRTDKISSKQEDAGRPEDAESPEDAGSPEDAAPDGASDSEEPSGGSQGIWYVDYYRDDFKQPTDEWYITAPAFPGTFNFDTTRDAKLSVEVRVNCYGEIAFLLYRYGDKLERSVGAELYYITMRTSEGTDYEMTGTLYESDHHLCIDEEYKSTVLETMRNGGTIHFYVEYSRIQGTNFLFSIDTDGFDSVYQSQTGA